MEKQTPPSRDSDVTAASVDDDVTAASVDAQKVSSRILHGRRSSASCRVRARASGRGSERVSEGATQVLRRRGERLPK